MAQPAPSPSNMPFVVLPFTLDDYHIILSLPMTQAGTGDKFRVPETTRPFRLMLDSGAGRSLLAEEAFAARNISLPVKEPGNNPKVRGIGNGSEQPARFLSNVVFLAGNASLKDEPLVAPLGTLYEAGIDGLLGEGIFHFCVVEVNYTNKTLKLYDPGSFTPPPISSGFVSVPIQFLGENHRATVPVDVTPFGFPRTTAHLEIDTGINGTVSFAAPFVKQNKWATFALRTIENHRLGMGGVSNSRRGRLKELRFGGVTLANPYADFSSDTQGSMTDTDKDGLLGGALLSRFTVIFDYSRSVVYVRPNAEVYAPFVLQSFGFQTEHTPNAAGGWLLVEVDANSPMSRAGIKKGETIFALDNKPVGKMTWSEFFGLLDTREGKRIFSVGDANGTKRRDVRVLPTTL